MPRFKDQAICIRDLDWSETSQVVVLLTRDHGKVRGIAKGSKRQSPSSLARFSGGIELLTAGQVIATTRPSTELASITEWDLQRDHFPLRRHLRSQRLAMYAADLCNALLADEDPHPRVFALLESLLAQLCATATARRAQSKPGGSISTKPTAQTAGDAAGDGAGNKGGRKGGREGGDEEGNEGSNEGGAALLVFQWGLLEEGGYRPELERDVRQGGDLTRESAYSFDPVAGGLTAQRGLNDWRVRSATVGLLRRLAAGEPVDGAGPDDLQRANRLLCVYLRAVLDKELPTMPLILGPPRRPG